MAPLRPAFTIPNLTTSIYPERFSHRCLEKWFKFIQGWVFFHLKSESHWIHFTFIAMCCIYGLSSSFSITLVIYLTWTNKLLWISSIYNQINIHSSELLESIWNCPRLRILSISAACKTQQYEFILPINISVYNAWLWISTCSWKYILKCTYIVLPVDQCTFMTSNRVLQK